MGFRSLRLYQYRNLFDTELDLEAPRLFFVGDNGQGKSNLLEAIYLASFGSSFRNARDGEIINTKKNEALVEAQYSSEGFDQNVQIKLSRGQKKEIRLDGKPISDRAALIRTVPAIAFSHGDMEFATGPPERRRWFFDQTQSLFDPLFIDLLRRYRRVMKSRNQALRDGRGDLLDVYDQQLAAAGVEIQSRRARTTENFDATFLPIFQAVSGLSSTLSIVYRPNWAKGSIEDAVSTLAAHRERDRVLQITTTGPHRDDFRFILDGVDFSRLASTGQTRLLALVLRVAQARYCAAKTGRRPLLLLDDVLLELDAEKRRKFLDRLPDCEQAFFTFLPDERFLDYRTQDTMIFAVSEGRLSPWQPRNGSA